jgi:HPt (histidine-containing phosphotransfer) domain-containing protein
VKRSAHPERVGGKNLWMGEASAIAAGSTLAQGRGVKVKAAQGERVGLRNLDERPPDSAPAVGAPRGDVPIDHAHCARVTLGNAALEREVLGLFRAQLPVNLARLGAAGDRRAWCDVAHTIKGAAAAVGAWRLADAAEAAERIDFASPEARAQAAAAIGAAAKEVCRYLVGRAAELSGSLGRRED